MSVEIRKVKKDKEIMPEQKLSKRKKDAKGNFSVASQWQLMWWKFKKHRMAMIAAPILIFLYLIALFCEFLAPSIPLKRFSAFKFAIPSAIHFVDVKTGFQLTPFVYGMKESVNTKTFTRSFKEDKTKKYNIQFFMKGESYKMWGLFETDIHLLGIKDQTAPFFLMGTDQLGRDLFTRVLYGTRISLSFGLIGIFFTLIFGLILGGISGYFGGILDTVIQRTIDLLISMPTIPLWMSLAAALPRSWTPIQIYLGMILIMSMIGWTDLARVVRGKILSLREEDFTMAARLCGAGNMRIIIKHLLPSFMSYIIVSITLSIPGTILGETALSFLGLGLMPPIVSWGVLLQGAQNIQTLAFHNWLLWPAAFIIVTVLMFNFLGDGMRDAADPYK